MVKAVGSTCGSCGGQMTADARFCFVCGAAVPMFCPECGAPRTSQARFCAECGAHFGRESSAVLTAPSAAPISALPIPAPARGARSPRRPIPPIALALAAVVVLVAGGLAIGIVKLPGAATSANLATGSGKIDYPAAPSGPVQSPPPIDNQATAAQGTLSLGNQSAVKTIRPDANGASATVSAPGQPWDGLKIDVPAGAWTGSTLQITAQPINGSSFGDLVTSISPLYTITGAKGMAPAPVTLKIPATIPDDSFGMGFFYDASTGRLEGMPLLAEDGTSVTVATEHFSSIFLSLVKRELLPETIDSGFRPGKDDWQFENRGSYVGHGGQCAGQVLTEAWYYLERHLKAGADRLYGLYDNNGAGATPRRWQDDSNGIRLGGVAQSQYEANQNEFLKFFANWQGMGFDELQYNAFRYAIAVTGEPQLMAITDANNGHGHAILAYRVSPDGILVADPNYPAAKRLVPFDAKTGKFGAYSSGENAADIAVGKDVSYTNFVNMAMRALVDWPTLAADWAAFDTGTTGVGLFPVYSLEALAGKDAQGKEAWVPLVDGYQTSEKSLTLRMRDPKGGDDVRMEVFPGVSETHLAPKDQLVTIPLQDGDNPLGIYEQGSQPAWTTWEYVDFVRVTVILGPAPTPSPTPKPTATATATPKPAPTSAATSQAGGRWVLTGAVEEVSPSWENEIDKVSIIDSSNGRFTVSWISKMSAPPEQADSSLTWGPPPASAVPGDTWTAPLSATATCTSGLSGKPGGGGVFVAAEYWARAIGDPDPDNKHTEWSVQIYCGHEAQSTQLSWAFPAHGDNGEIKITVKASGISGIWTAMDDWEYTYTWQP